MNTTENPYSATRITRIGSPEECAQQLSDLVLGKLSRAISFLKIDAKMDTDPELPKGLAAHGIATSLMTHRESDVHSSLFEALTNAVLLIVRSEYREPQIENTSTEMGDSDYSQEGRAIVHLLKSEVAKIEEQSFPLEEFRHELAELKGTCNAGFRTASVRLDGLEERLKSVEQLLDLDYDLEECIKKFAEAIHSEGAADIQKEVVNPLFRGPKVADCVDSVTAADLPSFMEHWERCADDESEARDVLPLLESIRHSANPNPLSFADAWFAIDKAPDELKIELAKRWSLYEVYRALLISQPADNGKTGAHDFSSALRLLMDGKKVRRSAWTRDCFLVYIPRLKRINCIQLGKNTATGIWAPGQADILATDWVGRR